MSDELTNLTNRIEGLESALNRLQQQVEELNNAIQTKSVIINGNVSSDTTDGITWDSVQPLNYGIHRTPGSWGASGFQQLRISWATGIILDPGKKGGSMTKSEVAVEGNTRLEGEVRIKDIDGVLHEVIRDLQARVVEAKAAADAAQGAATNAQATANSAQAAANHAQTSADNAQAAASNAQAAASNAQTSANNVQESVKSLVDSPVLGEFVKQVKYIEKKGYNVFVFPDLEAFDVYADGGLYSEHFYQKKAIWK